MMDFSIEEYLLMYDKQYPIKAKEYYTGDDVKRILEGFEGLKFKSVNDLNLKLSSNEIGLIERLKNNSWDLTSQYEHMRNKICVFRGGNIKWTKDGIKLIISLFKLV